MAKGNELRLPEHILAASDRLRARGAQVYVVGGAIRDLLLGKTPGDFDLATNFLPAAVAACFPFSVPTGIEHGTVSVWLNAKGEGPAIEVTTYRGESTYSDGRRPDQVTFMSRIEDDLARRDFTVNAIALEPFTKELVDPFNGQADLAARLLRAVGDARLRFGEDGLRVMRAVRLVAVLEFTLDPATEAAISPALPTVAKVSQERIRDELVKLLLAAKPSLGFSIMQSTGLFALVLPELALTAERLAAVDQAKTLRARLAVLLSNPPAKSSPAVATDRAMNIATNIGTNIMRRLRFSNEESEAVGHLINEQGIMTGDYSDAALRRMVGRIGEDALPDLFAMLAAEQAGDSDKVDQFKRRVANVLDRSRAIHMRDLAIDGDDVMRELALPPSRRVREILEEFRDLMLAQPELNQRDELLSRLKKMKN